MRQLPANYQGECQEWYCAPGRSPPGATARRALFLYNLRVSLRVKLYLAALFLGLTVWANAEPISQLKPTGYVNDFAHVLDAQTSVGDGEHLHPG